MPRTGSGGDRPCLATRAQLRGAGWSDRALQAAVESGFLVRVRRGVYTDAPLRVRARHLLRDGRPDEAFVAETRAVLMSMGPRAVAAERTAAVLWGFDLLVEPQLIDVHVPRDHHCLPRAGVIIRRRPGTSPVAVSVLGMGPLPVTGAVETVLHCALSRPLREAVVVADSALRTGRVRLDELTAAVAAWAGRPRAARLRRVLALVDPRSGSVLESVLRVLMALDGLHPISQVTLLDSHQRRIGIVDFWFLAARLVVECDGRRWHDPQDARDRDRVRDNETTRIGCRTLRFTWDDVLGEPAHVLAVIRDCLALAA